MRYATDTRPTRLNLLRARRRLERVREGSELLRRKREALVRELLRHARPAVDERARILSEAARAYPALLEALAQDGSARVSLTGDPASEVRVTMRLARLWGVPVASVEAGVRIERTMEARGTAPGTTGVATVEAAEAFEALAQALLEAAPREVLLRRLGGAVASTSRQVRALERRMEPALATSIVRMTGLLDEREREEHGRLRHFLRRRDAGVRGGGPDVSRT